MSYLHTIYTENIDEQHAAYILQQEDIHSFTMLTGAGFYHGGKENALVIHIVSPVESDPDVLRAATQIRRDFRQKCVMVTSQKLQQVTFT